MFRYESPDESCYSESTSVAGRQKKRRRRKADVESNSTGKVPLKNDSHHSLTLCSFFLSSTICVSKASSILSTSELVASSASLASMDPSQQEDYVASLRYFSSRTIAIQFPSSFPGEDLPILTHPNSTEEHLIVNPNPSQEHREEATGEGMQL